MYICYSKLKNINMSNKNKNKEEGKVIKQNVIEKNFY